MHDYVVVGADQRKQAIREIAVEPNYADILKKLWRRIRAREASIRGDAELIALSSVASTERAIVDRMWDRLRQIKERNFARDAETAVDLDAIEVIVKSGVLNRGRVLGARG